MLHFEQFVYSLFAETGLNRFVRVRSGVLIDTLAFHKDEGLQQEVARTSFGLNVIHHVTMLHVSIEPENRHLAREISGWEGVNPAKKRINAGVV